MKDVLDNVDNIEEARFSAKPTSYGNRSYLLKIKIPNRKYGMAVASVNGHNYVTTIFKTTDKGYEQWANKINKKTAAAPAPYHQAGSSSTQRGNVSYGLSTDDIINLLKSNVNKNDIRNNKLYQREDGYQIADDNETVDVVTIPENAIPDFKTKRELVTFIKNILGNERNITIKSTGDTVLVSNTGINRAVVKTRRSEYNEVFGAVRQLLENAKYSGFVEADERHQNVRGQDVYHSGLVIGTKPYSVMFKVDIPKVDSSHNYAGHKISDIRIAPSENANGYLNSPHTDDAIREVSLAVLRGKVNPARQKNNKLYQRAYAASRVDYDRPSLKAIGSGTGVQSHGYGLYYALERDTAEGYYEQFTDLTHKPLATEEDMIAAFNTFKTRDGKPFLDSYKVVPSKKLYRRLFKTCLMNELLMQKFENYRLSRRPISSFYYQTNFNHFALKVNKTDVGTTTHCSLLI